MSLTERLSGLQEVDLLLIQDPRETRVEIDPYADVADWHAAARGDGRCYGGVVATIVRRDGETVADWISRCNKIAAEIEDSDDLSRRKENYR